MSLPHLIVYLLVAMVCGLVGQALVRRSVGGFLVSTLLGLGGGIVGSWVARTLHLHEPFWITVGGRPFGVVWTIVGAALVALIASFVMHRRR